MPLHFTLTDHHHVVRTCAGNRVYLRLRYHTRYVRYFPLGAVFFNILESKVLGRSIQSWVNDSWEDWPPNEEASVQCERVTEVERSMLRAPRELILRSASPPNQPNDWYFTNYVHLRAHVPGILRIVTKWIRATHTKMILSNVSIVGWESLATLLLLREIHPYATHTQIAKRLALSICKTNNEKVSEGLDFVCGLAERCFDYIVLKPTTVNIWLSLVEILVYVYKRLLKRSRTLTLDQWKPAVGWEREKERKKERKGERKKKNCKMKDSAERVIPIRSVRGER